MIDSTKNNNFLDYQISELKLLRQGKVRDIYEVDAERLLMVATDRISAFDCVLPNKIPCKGNVLTQISEFWFNRFSSLVPNHLISSRVDEFPASLLTRLHKATQDFLSGRSILVNHAKVIPFECIVRGYLAGSGWKDYQSNGVVCGHKLPTGLVESSKLPKPIFTPATKAEEGHDTNISVKEMSQSLGDNLTQQLEVISLDLYCEAAAYAETRGIIICDTKFEFGIRNGELILVDELLTPDSSRFWSKETYLPSQTQSSFDKQFVRDYLETLNWNKHPPAPTLPEQIVKLTSQKYLDAYTLITGRKLNK